MFIAISILCISVILGLGAAFLGAVAAGDPEGRAGDVVSACVGAVATSLFMFVASVVWIISKLI